MINIKKINVRPKLSTTFPLNDYAFKWYYYELAYVT